MIRIALICSLALTAACLTKSATTHSPATASSSSLIGAAKAIEIAQGQVPGGVAIDVQLEQSCSHGHGPMYDVNLRVPGTRKPTLVAVHAVTGKVLNVGAKPTPASDDDPFEHMD